MTHPPKPKRLTCPLCNQVVRFSRLAGRVVHHSAAKGKPCPSSGLRPYQVDQLRVTVKGLSPGGEYVQAFMCRVDGSTWFETHTTSQPMMSTCRQCGGSAWAHSADVSR